MSAYTKTTNFTAKDALISGNPSKIVKGSEIDDEFTAIETAVNSKANKASPVITGSISLNGVVITSTAAELNILDGVTATAAEINVLDGITSTVSELNILDGVTATAAELNALDGITSTTAELNYTTGVTSSIQTQMNLKSPLISPAFTTPDLGTPSAATLTNATGLPIVAGTTGTLSQARGGTGVTTATNGQLLIGNGTGFTAATLTAGSGVTLTNGAGSIQVAFTGPGTGDVTLTGVETLTNKTLTAPILTAPVLGTPASGTLTNTTGLPLTTGVTGTLPVANGGTGITAAGTSGNVLLSNGTAWVSTPLTTDPTLGTLTQTFAIGEQSIITLSSAVATGAPVVSVTKEVAQTGVTNNEWDVSSTAENYTRLDSAPATTLDFIGDLSSASFVDSFSVAGQDITPTGIAFNIDGTKMFIVGSAGADINEYALATGFDVSTASYTQLFSVAAQDTDPQGIAFNADGTKMFIVGEIGNNVYEYALSTGFDVSTASYTQLFSVGGQDTNPTGVAFNTDGTKMFVIGYQNDNVNEYALSTGFNVSTASFTDSFSVTAQDTTPIDITFNADGTKMFIVGYTGKDINQYALTTGFDVSTASYTLTLSIIAQDNQPHGIAFSADEAKMFMIGAQVDAVYEYSLLELTLGTGSFAAADVGKTIEANSGVFVLTATDGSYVETTAPTSYAQVASGDWSMYGVVYNTVDGDLELSSGVVSSPFDVSCAVYSQTFSVAGQDLSPRGLAFSTDGTKMFFLGDNGKDVNEYTLSTGFDVSTATFVDSFSVNAQDDNMFGFTFNADGTKMFIVGYTNDAVFEYSLSTGFDISTTSYVRNFSVASQETTPRDVAFNTAGTKMFVLGITGDDVNEYTLSTGFNVSTASFVDSFSVSPQDTVPTSIAFNTAGTKMFILGATGQDVNEYALSTGFDVSTATYSQNFSVSAQETSPTGIAFNADGSKMFILGNAGDDINEYSFEALVSPTGYNPVHTTLSIDSTYWTDINSMTASQAAGDGNVYYAISTDDRTTWAVVDNTDGVRNIVKNNAGTWQYNSNGTYGSETWANGATNTELATLAEAMEGASVAVVFDVSAAAYSRSFSVSAQETFAQGLAFNTDGTKMFVVGYAGSDVNEYTLSTGFNVSTATFVDSFSVTAQETVPTDVAFNTDGTKMFVLGLVNDNINEYTLSTGFDVSTATFVDAFSVAAQETEPRGVAFNTDGTKMFIVGSIGDDVNEYALTTGFDVSTASFTDSFSVAAQETNPTAVEFNTDGTKMFVVGFTGDKVYEYTLSTGFDVSTATFVDSFSVASQDTVPNGLAFNTDGTKMFVVGESNDGVYEYTISGISYTNLMDKTQLDAVTDANQVTLGNDLDLAIILNLTSGTTVPSSNGVAINYDANVLNEGAILGTDYDFDAPATDKVRITALAANNLKVRVL
tara:strand:- start:3097 stop:7353 length:4257 start_codon:yes stop_codon:yes gene_type:complete